MSYIHLSEVVYDVRARDGTWCKLPYPNHPRGCPNFPQCPESQPNFIDIQNQYVWYAVLEEFDLVTHAEKMKRKHPNWSERQCRNLLYWQNSVVKRLKAKVQSYKSDESDIILEIPEASGINIFETLSQVGVILQRNHPNYIVKIMLLGKPKT